MLAGASSTVKQLFGFLADAGIAQSCTLAVASSSYDPQTGTYSESPTVLASNVPVVVDSFSDSEISNLAITEDHHRFVFNTEDLGGTDVIAPGVLVEMDSATYEVVRVLNSNIFVVEVQARKVA